MSKREEEACHREPALLHTAARAIRQPRRRPGRAARIGRNTLIEVVAGAAVIAIVAVLGVTPPGEFEEAMPYAHHHDH